ncbi:MAG: hypothetical protein HY541_02255 [Deltaproteobacteria bacterium]|nr:hypothetical protein [Deltaproteobacteria bacterium]
MGVIQYPKYFCIDNRCAEISEYYQQFVQEYNNVNDPYLCYSESGSCEVKAGEGVESVTADPKNDREAMYLLKEVSGWADKEQRELLNAYIVDLYRFGEGNPYTQICLRKQFCPKGTPQPEQYPFYNEWAGKMREVYGISVEPFYYDTIVVYGGLFVLGSNADGRTENFAGIPQVWVFRGSGCYFLNDDNSRSIMLQPTNVNDEQGAKDADTTGVHELTHAYLLDNGGQGYVPLWLNELLAYSLADPEYKPELPLKFYQFLSTFPMRQVLGIEPWPEGYRPNINSFFTHNVTHMMKDILLSVDPDAIKKIGHEIFSADFKNMDEEQKKKFWLSVLQDKLNTTPEQLVMAVEERIRQELAKKE